MERAAVLVVVSGLLAVSVAVLARGASGIDRPETVNAACKDVGWIAAVHSAVSKPSWKLSGAPKGCACPSKNCSKVAKDQRLFANETMSSGGGRITFKSTVKGVPHLTCIVSSKSQNIIYPQDPAIVRGARAVLKVLGGATSCQVEQGNYTNKEPAVFFVRGTAVKISALNDPVFGIKAVGDGSLIQVKKGTVRVGSKAVAFNQQVVDDGSSLGAVKPLEVDPVLKPALCELTPELRLTKVKKASGARPGGRPIGLAPDGFGYLWFTDDATPAIGRFNIATGKITYPNNGGVAADSVPRFIIADPTGMIWFTDAGPTPAIGRIDPRTQTIVEYALPPGSVPWNPAYDSVHKLVWFTDHRPNGAIGALDPASGQITAYTQGLNPGSHPQGIVVDRRGHVWFTDDNDPRPAIGRLDGMTHAIEEFETGLVEDSLPRGMTIDPVGRVWFADERTVDNSKPNAPGDGLIGMIDTADPKHEIVEYPVFTNGGNRHSIPEGLVWYGGFVWFTDDGKTKAIGRIDPTTGAVTESSKKLVADSQPIGIVRAKGSLYFTDRKQSAPKIGQLTAKTC
jgi:streptogramin lyase